MLMSSIYKVNIMKEKQSDILQVRGYLESLKVLIRLSKDSHILTLDKFIAISQSIAIISKQLVAW